MYFYCLKFWQVGFPVSTAFIATLKSKLSMSPQNLDAIRPALKI